MDAKVKKVTALLMADRELHRLTTGSDRRTIRAAILFAYDFEAVLKNSPTMIAKEGDYFASTIRSRMDTFFDFKYLLNSLVPESLKLKVAYPANDGALKKKYLKVLGDLLDKKRSNELRLLDLKRLLTLQLYFYGRYF